MPNIITCYWCINLHAYVWHGFYQGVYVVSNDGTHFRVAITGKPISLPTSVMDMNNGEDE